jgi:NAD(P)-dependent dehydrogenase (short-subunit alcohol dehydrogenase family)
MSRVILITGTSMGVGRTAAETMAHRGYKVFATMRDISGRDAATSEDLRSLAKREDGRRSGQEACLRDRTFKAEAPGPEDVVEAFVRLIETPRRGNDRSARCRRLPYGSFLAPYNAHAATMRDRLVFESAIVRGHPDDAFRQIGSWVRQNGLAHL